MKKLLSLTLAMLMLVTMLAGCAPAEQKPTDPVAPPTGDKPTTPTTPPADGEKLAKEQVITINNGAEPMTLDMSRRSDTYSSTILINILEGLTRMEETEDGGYKLAPAGAKEWSSNAEGTVWTFKLNDNKWSDGQPVTAEHYAYSLRRTADPNTAAPLGSDLNCIVGYDDVSSGKTGVEGLGVKAIDEKTLEITLSAPTPYFLELTHGMLFRPQREDFIKTAGDKYGAEANMVLSCGPFQIDSWEHNSKIVLKKNPNYWDAANVTLETVNYLIITDSNTSYNAFLNGETDTVSTGTAEWLEKFKAMKDVQHYEYLSGTITYSFFNTQDALFSNNNIRKAFMTGIDRVKINDMCFGGLRVPTYGWVAPSLFVDDVNFREYAGDPIKEMTEANNPKDLLLKGMEELGLGTDPATLKVTFNLAGTDQWFRTLGEYLQQAYKESLGINLEINFSEWGIFIDNVEKGNFQIGFMDWGASFNEPYDVLSLLTSDNNAIKTGWSNPKYDELIKTAKNELDPKKRIELYKQAEDILIREDAVVNPLATSTTNLFVKSNIKGYPHSPFSSVGLKYVKIMEK